MLKSFLYDLQWQQSETKENVWFYLMFVCLNDSELRVYF